MAKELKLTDGNPETVMQAEDMAELIIAQLKLNAYQKNSSIWSTNLKSSRKSKVLKSNGRYV
jgi:3-oxoacyl-[acyl-carrier protein] reductase